mgnify:CR=1 FL=1
MDTEITENLCHNQTITAHQFPNNTLPVQYPDQALPKEENVVLLILVLLEGVEVHPLALRAQLAEISGPAVRGLSIIVVIPDIP